MVMRCDSMTAAFLYELAADPLPAANRLAAPAVVLLLFNNVVFLFL
jgi:hypothetical protein